MANERAPKQVKKTLAYWVIGSIILDLLISLHIDYYHATHSIFEIAVQPITRYFVVLCLIFVLRIVTFGMLLDARRCYIQTITFILFNFAFLLWIREYHNNLMEMRDLGRGLYQPNDPRFMTAFVVSKSVFLITLFGTANLNVLFKYYAILGFCSIAVDYLFPQKELFNLTLGVLVYALSLLTLIVAVWHQTYPPKGMTDDQLLDVAIE